MFFPFNHHHHHHHNHPNHPLLVLLLLLIASPALAQQFRLLHRIFHPSLPLAPFAERAQIHLHHSGPSLTHAPELSTDLAQFILDAAPVKDALYLLALAPEGHNDEAAWPISSVKACHLPLAHSDLVTIHLARDGSPYSLDYFLAPIPHHAACPSKRTLNAAPPPSLSNTTVLLSHPTYPPLPELRVPPPLSPQGEPITPVPEKSFLQKYWMYAVIALVALSLSGGAEEEGAPRARAGAQ